MRIILKSLFGALCGGISGAALLAIPTYFLEQNTWMGTASGWAWFAGTIGFLLGFVPGALIGFFVPTFQTSKFTGAIIGASVGLILVIWAFVSGYARSDPVTLAISLAPIPIGAAIGLILSATNKKHV